MIIRLLLFTDFQSFFGVSLLCGNNYSVSKISASPAVTGECVIDINGTMLLMPSTQDFTYAALAIVRLQEMYGDEADFTRQSDSTTHGDVLTGLPNSYDVT